MRENLVRVTNPDPKIRDLWRFSIEKTSTLLPTTIITG